MKLANNIAIPTYNKVYVHDKEDLQEFELSIKTRLFS